MDRLRLKQYLEAARVPADMYLLVGVDPPRAVSEGACIVRPNQYSWEVLVWEPARLTAPLTFVNEDQACSYALDRLTPAAGRHRLAVAEPPVEVTPRSGAEAEVEVEVAPAALTSVPGMSPLSLQL
jgi:hypothetical protein